MGTGGDPRRLFGERAEVGSTDVEPAATGSFEASPVCDDPVDAVNGFGAGGGGGCVVVWSEWGSGKEDDEEAAWMAASVRDCVAMPPSAEGGGGMERLWPEPGDAAGRSTDREMEARR
jgi:hypothetical protein